MEVNSLVDVVPMEMYEALSEVLNGFALKLEALESRISALESTGASIPVEVKAAVKVVADFISK